MVEYMDSVVLMEKLLLLLIREKRSMVLRKIKKLYSGLNPTEQLSPTWQKAMMLMKMPRFILFI